MSIEEVIREIDVALARYTHARKLIASLVETPASRRLPSIGTRRVHSHKNKQSRSPLTTTGNAPVQHSTPTTLTADPELPSPDIAPRPSELAFDTPTPLTAAEDARRYPHIAEV